jgi:hypothetical protein
VADALQRGSDICLVATCHDVIWTATELELEQIREYFCAVHRGGDDQSHTHAALFLSYPGPVLPDFRFIKCQRRAATSAQIASTTPKGHAPCRKP